MSIELPIQQRADAIASLRRYFEENMPEPIGELPATLLLNFFIEEAGPAIYNKGVSDAQVRIHKRLGDIESELYEDEFQYWPRVAARRSKSK